MAKKLKRVRVQASPISLFIQIMIPWIVMAGVFVAAEAAGLDTTWAVVIAIIAALYTTFMVNRASRLMRARRAAIRHDIAFDVRRLKDENGHSLRRK